MFPSTVKEQKKDLGISRRAQGHHMIGWQQKQINITYANINLSYGCFYNDVRHLNLMVFHIRKMEVVEHLFCDILVM